VALRIAQMGRFQSAANPDDPAGTNDEAAAAKDQSGNPVSNGARNVWITETALATALNVSYMAQQISIFGIVVGIALLLTGIGLVIVAFRCSIEIRTGAGRRRPQADPNVSAAEGAPRSSPRASKLRSSNTGSRRVAFRTRRRAGTARCQPPRGARGRRSR
jgi:hypothetical protein